MNKYLRWLFAGFYGLSKRAYAEYNIAKIKNGDNIILGENCCIGDSAVIPTNKGGKIFIGDRTWFLGSLIMFPHNNNCDFSIGNDGYIGDGTRIWCAKSIKIGDRVLIAHNVNIFDTTTHPINKEIRYEHEEVVKAMGMPKKKYDTIEEVPIVIKDDVWIGCNSIILKGVTIGEGTIVGAGSIVTKDVPENVVVAGNPAVVVKRLESV